GMSRGVVVHFRTNRRFSDQPAVLFLLCCGKESREDRVKQLIQFVATLSLALSGTAAAQDYPSRPVTLVVPYAAGGGNDVMARIVAEKMSRSLGQQIVIENKGGAGGSIATRQVAKSPPDGYTLGLGGTGTLAINPTLYANVGYDPRRDFEPVGLIATSALVVLVKPTVAEAALPGYEAVLNYGSVEPAGTPKPIIEKLSVALKAALREPDVREKIEADGAELASMTPAEYAADIDREETKWSAIVKLSG